MFILDYTSKADCFEKAFPVGNGRVGAMVYADPQKEKISLNEDTFWSGYPGKKGQGKRYQSYERAAELTKAGFLKEAYEEIDQNFLGEFSESYLPVGQFWVETGHGSVTSYRRSLDLENGEAVCTYAHQESPFVRTTFVSWEEGLVVWQMESLGEEKCSLLVGLDSPLSHRVKAFPDSLWMEVEAPGHVRPRYGSSRQMEAETICYYEEEGKKGIKAVAQAKILTDGKVRQKGCAYDRLHIEEASYVYVVIAVHTSFGGRNPKELCQFHLHTLSVEKLQEMRRDHRKTFSQLSDRAKLQLNGVAGGRFGMDEILDRLMDQGDAAGCVQKKCQHQMSVILYQMGRYLLISSSTPGSRAGNLQGIWNEEPRPMWSCNYTLNINLQMYYWPACMVGLQEFALPYFELVKGLEEAGRETAWDSYRCKGSVVHHNTDLWQITHPVGHGKPNAPTACFWNLAGGWFVCDIWDRYLFTRDKGFLEEYLPVMEGFLTFYCDAISIEGKRAYLLPSTSPENRFYLPGPGRESTSICRMSTMSVSILRQAFAAYRRAYERLPGQGDVSLYNQIGDLLPMLPEYRIGSRGQLLEWEEEYEEVQENHRHISHLYGIYPGNDIDWRDRRLCRAVRRSMELRGNEGTGWSLAWKTGVWARLGDGSMAGRLLHRFMHVTLERDPNKSVDGGGICPNLFCSCPPVQIDGNFGITAGITEMLLQSGDGCLRLLPGRPKEWKAGSITGVGTRTGMEAELSWKQEKDKGMIIELVLKGKEQKEISVFIGDFEERIMTAPGENRYTFYDRQMDMS